VENRIEIEKSKRALAVMKSGDIRRGELAAERNRKEGSARYAKLLKQVDTNRS
jgi:hypothetical protein